MKLFRKSDDTEVKPGELIEDHRGDKWRFRSITEGRVSLKILVEDEKTGNKREFYSSVFNGGYYIGEE